MSVKAKLPEEDPETVARREQAERRADQSRIEDTQEGLSDDTRAVLRRFGRLERGINPRSLAGFNPRDLGTSGLLQSARAGLALNAPRSLVR